MKPDTSPAYCSSLEDIRSKIWEGLNALDRGEIGTMTLEEILAEGQRGKGMQPAIGITADAKTKPIFCKPNQ